MNGVELEVLIVEDNPGDARLISELLEDMNLPLHVTLVKDGQEALDILGKGDGHTDRPAPDLIILDLNLPKVNGFEVLAYTKATQKLRSIPIVVMTGSLKREDEVKARSMGASDYCMKPASVGEMDRSAKCLRGHLETLSRGKGKRSVPRSSARVDQALLTMAVGYRPIRPPCNARFSRDLFDTEMWKPLG